jgi:predicted RNA-binding Zn ribbon-like protein
MNQREKRQIGEQIEPGGRSRAPGRLELLQRFINSYNHDFPLDWDRLGTAAKAQAWLRKNRLVAPSDRISEAEAARLREFREALRALVIAHRHGERNRAAGDVVRAAAGNAALVVDIDAAGDARLVPGGAGMDAALAALLAILHEAQLTGDWQRLSACRQCEYVIYDRSKNRSAAWCSMSICGNRVKNRAYYRRRHSAA